MERLQTIGISSDPFRVCDSQNDRHTTTSHMVILRFVATQTESSADFAAKYSKSKRRLCAPATVQTLHSRCLRGGNTRKHKFLKAMPALLKISMRVKACAYEITTDQTKQKCCAKSLQHHMLIVIGGASQNRVQPDHHASPT